ncbi:MAG: glycosyltransferase family A protein [Pyrinomonadaceae bacterium]
MNERLADRSSILKRLTETRIGKDVAPDPLVSIIIPAYNIAPYIRETLESVLAQTRGDFEAIIVNDGSSDTEDLERELDLFFDRIVYARQENAGASAARNAAICLSRGEALAFLDGDDVWLPDYLSQQLEFLENSPFEMIYCDAEIIGQPHFEGENYMLNAPSDGEVTPVSLITAECNVITSGTVLRRSVLEKFDLFDIDLPRTQDFELWFRLARQGVRIGYQKKILLRYRVRPGNLTGDNISRARRDYKSLEIIREKYDLTGAEAVALKKMSDIYESVIYLEMGKTELRRENFPSARENFRRAESLRPSLKQKVLNFILTLSPRLVLLLFKKFRPEEFGAIARKDPEK